MVFDRIEEQERYYGLHPMMEEAFAFLAESDTLNPGRYELSGGMYAMVSEGDTRQIRDVQRFRVRPGEGHLLPDRPVHHRQREARQLLDPLPLRRAQGLLPQRI